MQVRLLTWSLTPGVSECESPEALAVALDGFDCDVAALINVPAHWAAHVARHSVAEFRQLPPRRRSLRRMLAEAGRGRARGTAAIVARRDRLIDDRVERWSRRRVLGARLACGLWMAVLETAAGEQAATGADAAHAARTALGWAEGGAVALALPLAAAAPPLARFVPAASRPGAQLLLAGPVERVRATVDPHGPLILDVRLGSVGAQGAAAL